MSIGWTRFFYKNGGRRQDEPEHPEWIKVPVDEAKLIADYFSFAFAAPDGKQFICSSYNHCVTLKERTTGESVTVCRQYDWKCVHGNDTVMRLNHPAYDYMIEAVRKMRARQLIGDLRLLKSFEVPSEQIQSA